MQVAVREVVVMTETGKRLRILTNDLDAPAQEIADLYKRRWLIELFFRLMKQMLRITRFLGRSENAVRIQIAVALIAFLILHLLHKITQVKHGLLEFVQLVRANIMHRKDITRLRQILPPPPIDSANWPSTGDIHEPDSRGTSPAMTESEKGPAFPPGLPCFAKIGIGRYAASSSVSVSSASSAGFGPRRGPLAAPPRSASSPRFRYAYAESSRAIRSSAAS